MKRIIFDMQCLYLMISSVGLNRIVQGTHPEYSPNLATYDFLFTKLKLKIWECGGH